MKNGNKGMCTKMKKRGNSKNTLRNSDEFKRVEGLKNLNRQKKGTAYVYANIEADKSPYRELSGIPGITIEQGTGYDIRITVDDEKEPEPLADTVSRILDAEGIKGQPAMVLCSYNDETSKKAVVERIRSNGVDMRCVKC